MKIKQLSMYRIPLDFDANRLEDGLKAAHLQPIGPTEPERNGFVSPFGPGSEVMLHKSGECVLFELETLTKILPPSVVNGAVEAKAAAHRSQKGKTPGKKLRSRMKDEVLLDLLPKALVKSTRLYAYIDLQIGALFIASASDRQCEAVISELRVGLGSFVCEPMQGEESPAAVLTQWLAAGECPEPFGLGDECQLVDPVDTGCAVKAKRHDLALDEIREHVKSGKKVSQLALVFDNRLRFVLDEKLKIRRLKLLDIVQESIELRDGESDANAELDASFTLITLELRRLFWDINTQFGLGIG